MACEVCAIRVEFPSIDPTTVTINRPDPINVSVLPMGIRDLSRPYEGEYEFTPTQETQTIPIGGMKALRDIIINPIPNNYGLITWDGSTLTVS